VLTGVDEDLAPTAAANFAREDGRFDELRSSTNDREDLHGSNS
jgi:hypothetical protein